MIPAPFKYQRVSSIDEAVRVLRADPEAKLLSGGHSLLPMMKLRLARPSQLVDVSRIPELRTIDIEENAVSLGASVRYYEVAQDARLAEVMPILGQAVSMIADPQVRHRGTVGGSAAHADPASDLAAVLLATEAEVKVRGPHGERAIAAADWYLAPMVSDLRADEVLTAIVFPRPLPARQVYVKFPHPASGYALAGAAVLFDMDDAHCVSRVRIAVTGAAAMPFRATSAESRLEGQTLDADLWVEAAEAGAYDGEYADDPQYPADYRRNLAQVMIQRALERILLA